MRTTLLCLLLAACSSSTSDHTKACHDVSAARCARLMTCSSGDFARRYPSMDVCVTRLA